MPGFSIAEKRLTRVTQFFENYPIAEFNSRPMWLKHSPLAGNKKRFELRALPARVYRDRCLHSRERFLPSLN